MIKQGLTYRSVRGPYATKTGIFRVQLIGLDNRVRERRFKTKEEADKFTFDANVRVIDEAKKTRTALELPEYENTLAWFGKAISTVSYNLVVTRDFELTQVLKALSSAGIAFKQLYDTADLEEQFNKLQTKIQDIQSARAHGTRVAWANQGGSTVAPKIAANE